MWTVWGLWLLPARHPAHWEGPKLLRDPIHAQLGNLVTCTVLLPHFQCHKLAAQALYPRQVQGARPFGCPQETAPHPTPPPRDVGTKQRELGPLCLRFRAADFRRVSRGTPSAFLAPRVLPAMSTAITTSYRPVWGGKRSVQELISIPSSCSL